MAQPTQQQQEDYDGILHAMEGVKGTVQGIQQAHGQLLKFNAQLASVADSILEYKEMEHNRLAQQALATSVEPMPDTQAS
eukprot:m.10484 g.10484  ORF g.10484 m.10484 type:complete len:80 (-) comp5572_c0_seq1:2090-2329(-)